MDQRVKYGEVSNPDITRMKDGKILDADKHEDENPVWGREFVRIRLDDGSVYDIGADPQRAGKLTVVKWVPE